jgi:putative hydrolase of the HAD superfamily
MIRAVLFDLDRTLLDRDNSFHHFVLSQYDLFSHALVKVPRETYVSRVIALDERGRVGKDKVYQTIFHEFPIRGISWQDLLDDFEARIADFYVPFPGLRTTLDRLKSSGHLIGLISNGREAFQRRTLRKLEIEQDFDVILISESEGVRKPDAEIFRRALLKMECAPRKSVFVGDHPEVDIKGAHDAGMRTIWKINDDFIRPTLADAAFHDLNELPAIIDHLSEE